MNIDMVDASERFLSKLAGVSDPEKKIIIGRISCFDEESHKFEGAKFLVKGTIYPDVIESQSVKATFCCDKISPQCRWDCRGNETSTSEPQNSFKTK